MEIALVRMDLDRRTDPAGSLPVMRAEEIKIRHGMNQGRDIGCISGPRFPRGRQVGAEGMIVVDCVTTDIEAEREIIWARAVALVVKAVAPRKRHAALCEETMTMVRHARLA